MTTEENTEEGHFEYMAVPNTIYAGACDDCVIGWGNCQFEITGLGNYCIDFAEDEAQICGLGQTACTKAPRTGEGANSTILTDTSCVDKSSSVNEDPYRKCPASICTHGTEGYCYQPETGLCLDYMPGTYEGGTDGNLTDAKCYEHTVPCYYETNAQCADCVDGTEGPCKQSINFADGVTQNLCFPTMGDSARETFLKAVIDGDLTCSDVPKARDCNGGTKACGEIVRPLVPPQCGAAVCSDSAGSCFKATDDGSKTECTNYIEMLGYFINNPFSTMMQNMDANKDFVIDYVQSFEDGNLKTSRTCAEDYTDCATLVLECPEDTLCRRSGADAHPVDLGNVMTVDGTYSDPSNEGTPLMINDTARINPQQLLMADIDGDLVMDYVIASIGHIEIVHNKVNNVSQCRSESAYGGEPRCGSWSEGVVGQGEVLNKGRCFPDEAFANDTICGTDFSSLPFGSDERFEKIIVSEFAGTCTGATIENGRGCELRSVQSTKDSTKEDANTHKWKFCESEDTANVLTTPSTDEACFPLVPHMVAADFTGDGADDILVARYEKKDATTGDDADDYELVVQVITKSSEQPYFGGENYILPSACSDSKECYYTVTVELEQALVGAVISVATHTVGDTVVVAIGTTTNLYLMSASEWGTKTKKGTPITLSLLDQKASMQSQISKHFESQTVTDIVFHEDAATRTVSVFWADYFGQVIRHIYIEQSGGKLVSKMVTTGDDAVKVVDQQLTQLSLGEVAGKVVMVGLGRHAITVANGTDCAAEYKYAFQAGAVNATKDIQCVQQIGQLIKVDLAFTEDKVTMDKGVIAAGSKEKSVLNLGRFSLPQDSIEHVIKNIQVGDINNDDCLDLLISVDDQVLLLTDGACAHASSIQRPCQGDECQCGFSGCETTSTVTTATTSTSTTTTSTTTTVTTLFDWTKTKCEFPDKYGVDGEEDEYHSDAAYCHLVLGDGVSQDDRDLACGSSSALRLKCKTKCGLCPDETTTTAEKTPTTTVEVITTPVTTTTTTTIGITTTSTAQCDGHDWESTIDQAECTTFQEVGFIDAYCRNQQAPADQFKAWAIELKELCPYTCGAKRCDQKIEVALNDVRDKCVGDPTETFELVYPSGRAAATKSGAKFVKPLDTYGDLGSSSPAGCAAKCTDYAGGKCLSFSVRTKKSNGDSDNKCILFGISKADSENYVDMTSDFSTFSSYYKSAECASMNTGSMATFYTNETVTDKAESEALLTTIFASLADCPSVADAFYSANPVEDVEVLGKTYKTEVTYTFNAIDGLNEGCLDAFVSGSRTIGNTEVETFEGVADALIPVATCFSMEKMDSDNLEADNYTAFCEHGYVPGLMSISCSSVSCLEVDKAKCCAEEATGGRRRREADADAVADAVERDLSPGTYFPLDGVEVLQARIFGDALNMAPALVLVPISKEDFMVSERVYKSNVVSESKVTSANPTMIANRLAAMVDTDGDGDMDVVYTEPTELISTAWCSYNFQMRRNSNDSSAGKCKAITSKMTTHDDVCEPCDANDATCV